jgi:hypothetical protein
MKIFSDLRQVSNQNLEEALTYKVSDELIPLDISEVRLYETLVERFAVCVGGL